MRHELIVVTPTETLEVPLAGPTVELRSRSPADAVIPALGRRSLFFGRDPGPHGGFWVEALGVQRGDRLAGRPLAFGRQRLEVGQSLDLDGQLRVRLEVKYDAEDEAIDRAAAADWEIMLCGTGGDDGGAHLIHVPEGLRAIAEQGILVGLAEADGLAPPASAEKVLAAARQAARAEGTLHHRLDLALNAARQAAEELEVTVHLSLALARGEDVEVARLGEGQAFLLEDGRMRAIGEAPPAPPGPRAVRRHAACAYYRQMAPDHSFPLAVVLSHSPSSRPYLDGLLRDAHLDLPRKDPGFSGYWLSPVFPGCLVSPERLPVDATAEPFVARFQVTPIAAGRFAEARVELAQRERPAHFTLATPTRVRRQRAAKLALLLAGTLPAVSAFMAGSPLVDRLANAGDPFSRALHYLLSAPDARWGWAACFLIAALVLWLFCLPQRAGRPVVGVVELEVEP